MSRVEEGTNHRFKFEEWTADMGAQQLKEEQQMPPAEDLEPTIQMYNDYYDGLEDPPTTYPNALWAQSHIADKLRTICKEAQELEEVQSAMDDTAEDDAQQQDGASSEGQRTAQSTDADLTNSGQTLTPGTMGLLGRHVENNRKRSGPYRDEENEGQQQRQSKGTLRTVWPILRHHLGHLRLYMLYCRSSLHCDIGRTRCGPQDMHSCGNQKPHSPGPRVADWTNASDQHTLQGWGAAGTNRTIPMDHMVATDAAKVLTCANTGTITTDRVKAQRQETYNVTDWTNVPDHEAPQYMQRDGTNWTIPMDYAVTTEAVKPTTYANTGTTTKDHVKAQSQAKHHGSTKWTMNIGHTVSTPIATPCDIGHKNRKQQE